MYEQDTGGQGKREKKNLNYYLLLTIILKSEVYVICIHNDKCISWKRLYVVFYLHYPQTDQHNCTKET